jgi:hypothetical protein
MRLWMINHLRYSDSVRRNNPFAGEVEDPSFLPKRSLVFTLSFNRPSVDMHNYRHFIDSTILAY